MKTSKLFLMLTAVIMCLFVSSCSEDDDDLNVIRPVSCVGNLDVLNVNSTTIDRLEGRDHEVESRDRILGLIADSVRNWVEG